MPLVCCLHVAACVMLHTVFYMLLPVLLLPLLLLLRWAPLPLLLPLLTELLHVLDSHRYAIEHRGRMKLTNSDGCSHRELHRVQHDTLL